jgi:hypothetical protein
MTKKKEKYATIRSKIVTIRNQTNINLKNWESILSVFPSHNELAFMVIPQVLYSKFQNLMLQSSLDDYPVSVT